MYRVTGESGREYDVLVRDPNPSTTSSLHLPRLRVEQPGPASTSKRCWATSAAGTARS